VNRRKRATDAIPALPWGYWREPRGLARWQHRSVTFLQKADSVLVIYVALSILAANVLAVFIAARLGRDPPARDFSDGIRGGSGRREP
jgi:hypothetical protein